MLRQMVQNLKEAKVKCFTLPVGNTDTLMWLKMTVHYISVDPAI